MNGDALKKLDLEPYHVDRIASAYLGYGLARWREAERQADAAGGRASTWAQAAGSFGRAGEYYAGLDANTASLAFWAAAQCSAVIGANRSMTYAICANDTNTPVPTRSPASVGSPDDYAARFLYEAMSALRVTDPGLEWIVTLDDTVLHANVDGTSTQLRSFMELRDAAVAVRDGPFPVKPVREIIEGAAAAVHRAGRDRYHWRQLRSALTPVPAQALAAVVVYFTASADRGELVDDEFAFAPEASTIIESGRSLAYARPIYKSPNPVLNDLATRRGGP